MLPKTSPFWLVPSNTAWFLRFLFSSEYSWRVFWFSFFTYQASRSLILTIYSLVWAKDSRKHLCRFLGVFSCRIRCFINPDTSTTLKSDLCFLSQKVRCSVSALLPVSQFENSSRQKSGVTGSSPLTFSLKDHILIVSVFQCLKGVAFYILSSFIVSYLGRVNIKSLLGNSQSNALFQCAYK